MQSGPIQIFPPGLLGFLQLKNQGKNPNQLPDTLQAVMDLREWLFEATAVDRGAQVGVSTVAVGPGAVGYTPFTTNPITVPDSEYWYIKSFHVEAPLAAATDAVAFGLAYSTVVVGVTQRYSMFGNPQPLLPGTAVARRGFANAAGVFVPPQSTLGVMVGVNDTAATITYSGYLRYVPLPF